MFYAHTYCIHTILYVITFKICVRISSGKYIASLKSIPPLLEVFPLAPHFPKTLTYGCSALYSILFTLNEPLATWVFFLEYIRETLGSIGCYRKLFFNFTNNSPNAVFIMMGRSRRLVDPFIIRRHKHTQFIQTSYTFKENAAQRWVQ